MSDERQSQPDDKVELPEDSVEDLEPEGDDAADVKGGYLPGNTKYTNIKLSR
jgi:hypothetical protein